MKKQRVVILLFLIFIAFISCFGPENEGNKKKVVELLDREYLAGGRWGLYWDGKNSDGKYISPGKYLYQLQANGFDRVKEMNAIEGGKEGFYRDSLFFHPGYWATFDLDDSYPEPFEIKAGVIIPFQVKGDGAVLTLTIFKE